MRCKSPIVYAREVVFVAAIPIPRRKMQDGAARTFQDYVLPTSAAVGAKISVGDRFRFPAALTGHSGKPAAVFNSPPLPPSTDRPRRKPASCARGRSGVFPRPFPFLGRLLIHGAIWLMFTSLYRFWLAPISPHLWTGTARRRASNISGPRARLARFLIAIAILLPLNAALFIVTRLGESRVAAVGCACRPWACSGNAVYRARRYRLRPPVYRGLRFIDRFVWAMRPAPFLVEPEL